MENKNENIIGIVGLGLMGCSIIADMLIHDCDVIGIAPIPEDLTFANARIQHNLAIAYEHGFVKQAPTEVLRRLLITSDYAKLNKCELVIECVVENVEIKKAVFQKIEESVDSETIITTNTSAIPISILKDFLKKPNRFLGMHYAEPSFTTKFLELICSDETDIQKAELLYEMSQKWGKEPTLVRKDIRGFITNRIMYAMYREAFYLVENGYATIEDVDRTCRNDGGHWMPFCGLFRYMDITGLQAYYKVMGDLFPTLNNQTHTPDLIEKIAKEGGNGITNGKGFYNYTPQEAAEWEKAYEEFAFDISRLSAKYPIDLVQQRLNGNGNGKH
jgi:3-hydroxybutyryl-CoA dehydrogenase